MMLVLFLELVRGKVGPVARTGVFEVELRVRSCLIELLMLGARTFLLHRCRVMTLKAHMNIRWWWYGNLSMYHAKYIVTRFAFSDA